MGFFVSVEEGRRSGEGGELVDGEGVVFLEGFVGGGDVLVVVLFFGGVEGVGFEGDEGFAGRVFAEPSEVVVFALEVSEMKRGEEVGFEKIEEMLDLALFVFL